MIYAQRAIGLKTGMIFANPVPKDKEADPEKVKAAIEQAHQECTEKDIKGALITPYMLKKINEITDGNSSAANIELVKNNVALGARIAIALCKLNQK